MKIKSKRVGRQPVPRHLHKEQLGIKLPRWLLQWLRKQPQSNAVLIEDALVRQHNLNPPTKSGKTIVIGLDGSIAVIKAK